jgi:hypothetical protein
VKAREVLGVSTLDAARVSQRLWEKDRPTLGEGARQVAMAVCAVLLHADGAMQAAEVAGFKLERELLGLEKADLGFLKRYVGQKAEELARALGTEQVEAVLPHWVRMVATDGALRPNEMNALRAALDAVQVGSVAREGAAVLVGFEVGTALEI